MVQADFQSNLRQVSTTNSVLLEEDKIRAEALVDELQVIETTVTAAEAATSSAEPAMVMPGREARGSTASIDSSN